MTIAASNVQITKSRVNGSVWIDAYPSSYSFSVTDSEVIADSSTTGANDGATGIGKSNFTATRDNIRGGIRAIWCEYSCTEQGNYRHGQLTDPNGAAHESGTRMGSGPGQLINHNTILCDAPDVPPDAGCSADMTGYGDFAPIQNNTISANLFLATTGGTCTYGGASGNNGSKPYGGDSNHIVFRNNIFQKRSSIQSSGKCGVWFGNADYDQSRPGNQWINNK